MQDKGTTTLDGASTHLYSLAVDPTKATGALSSALSLVGKKALPAQLWLDGSGRPVQIELDVALGSQGLKLLVKISKFNAPVTIKAPAADQVSGD